MTAYATGVHGDTDPERIRISMTRYEAKCILALLTIASVQRTGARMGLTLLEPRLREKLGAKSEPAQG